MDLLFCFKIFLSFIIGGIWVVVATVLADKLGSKIGGLISGLPSTVMFGLFFLGWTQNSEAAVSATSIIPIVGGINCLFLVVYVYFIKKNFWKAVLSSIFLWLILSYILTRLHFNNYVVSIFSYIFLFIISFVFMEHFLKITSKVGKKINYTPMVILIRAFVGGTVIALSVYVGKIGGPILGGMISMFPAMFISTIFVTYFTQGPLFSAGMMKSSMISAISVIVYSIIVRVTYIPLGILHGTLISIFISFGFGFLLYKSVITKLQ